MGLSKLCIEIFEVENGYLVREITPDRYNGTISLAKTWVAPNISALSKLVEKLAEEKVDIQKSKVK